MANQTLIKAIVNSLADIDPYGKSLIDISCGSGDLLLALKNKGFILRGTRFERKFFGFKDKLAGTEIEVDENVDILKGLPYPDQSFDVVLNTECIEHIENHRLAISEFARILKPGGVLILSTPNIMRLSSRLSFFLTGMHKTRRPVIPYNVRLKEAFRYHNYPVYLPVFSYLLEAYGLKIENFIPYPSKLITYFLYFLLFPFIKLITLFTLRVKEKELAQTGDWKKLYQLLTCREVLLCDVLIMKIKKIT